MISGAVGPGDHENEKSSIWLVSILGGKPRRLRGGAFRAMLSPDDSLVAYQGGAGGQSIMLADADGENPRDFIETGVWEWVGSPAWSSDGKRVVYRRVGVGEGGLVATIESRGLDEESSTVLVRGDAVADWNLIWGKDFLMLDDRLVFAKDEPAPRSRDQNLWEIAIDPGSGEPSGEPRRLTDWVGFNIIDLSATADGSQLVFGNDSGQQDVYVGKLGDGGRSLDVPRRLTLDDRDDLPACWTPDGGAVVFQSDRYGNEDLFVQELDQRNARDLVTGAGDQIEPHLTPDGASFLYWELQEGTSVWTSPRRLLRIPVGGGPTELVFESQALALFDCATTADGPCLLFEPRGTFFTLNRLDPVAGKGEELSRRDLDPSASPVAALSPDGSRFAVVSYAESTPSIRLVDVLTDEIVRNIEVDGFPSLFFSDVEWSPDGSGLYLIGERPRGVALLHVDLQGEAHVLHEDQTGEFFSVMPSPDGRHLAFGKETRDTNIWMIEKF